MERLFLTYCSVKPVQHAYLLYTLIADVPMAPREWGWHDVKARRCSISDATITAYLKAFVASATHWCSPVTTLNVAAQSPAAYTSLTDVSP